MDLGKLAAPRELSGKTVSQDLEHQVMRVALLEETAAHPRLFRAFALMDEVLGLAGGAQRRQDRTRAYAAAPAATQQACLGLLLPVAEALMARRPPRLPGKRLSERVWFWLPQELAGIYMETPPGEPYTSIVGRRQRADFAVTIPRLANEASQDYRKRVHARVAVDLARLDLELDAGELSPGVAVTEERRARWKRDVRWYVQLKLDWASAKGLARAAEVETKAVTDAVDHVWEVLDRTPFSGDRDFWIYETGTGPDGHLPPSLREARAKFREEAATKRRRQPPQPA